ncbi:MAG TPA: diguanylate cyclase [Albitalea sp.]|uniref:diguanylate cyclase n=1 Tax=Piscinibacter sp. TaxID=1903157 RepID=UPI002ED5172E
MKFLHENKVTVVLFGCGLLLLAALAGGFYLQYLNDSAEDGRHRSTQRLLALEETLTRLQDVRVHQGALLITGKPEHLVRFDDARDQLARSVDTLQALYADGDTHNERVIAELKRLYGLKVHELLVAAEMHRSSGFDVARAMFMSRQADDYGTAIRLLIEHLKQRDEEANRATNQLIGRQHVQLLSAAVCVFALALLCGGLTHVSLRREIRQRQAMALRLEHEATHDALTGLPNRRSFMHDLERSVARAQRVGSTLAVLFIDLDGFKRINDELGHHSGDTLLQQVAAQFGRGLRKSDLLARLGGDEFAVIAEATPGDAALHLAERLIAMVSLPLIDGQGELAISASIGVAVYASDGSDGTALLSAADAAMYQAKRAGRGRVMRAQRI